MSTGKSTALIALLLCFTISLAAQDLYTIVYDEPDDVLDGHVAIEFYGVDVGFGNIHGAMLFIVGVNGAYTLNDKFSVEGAVRLPLLRFEGQGTGYIVDGGAMLKLNSTTANRDVRVILGYKEEDIPGTDKRLATTKYVNLNGAVTRSVILRGGLYLKNTSLDNTESLTIDYKPTTVFHKGVYIGIGKQRQYFFQLERDIRGKKTTFGAGSIFRPYFDIMILPTSATLVQDTFGMGEGVSKEMNGLIGARAGFRWYRNPFTRDQNGNHRISFFGNAVVTLEAGTRPLEGFFFNGAISFIIQKF